MVFSRTKLVGLLAVIVAACSAPSARAANADATPFTCGNGQAANVVPVTFNPKIFGIGKSLKAVTAISDGQKGRAGVDFNNIDQTFFSIGLFIRDSGNAAKYVNTKFCFSDANGSFTIQKKLDTYRMNDLGGGWTERIADSREFGTIRVFQAKLIRVTEVLNTPNSVPANITFGGISLQDRSYREINPPAGNGGCPSADACDKDDNVL